MTQGTLLLLAAALGIAMPLATHASDLPRPEYGVKVDTPATGTNFRRHVLKPMTVPINRRYSELTPDERRLVHAWWESIPAGDEPPYPEAGMKPILEGLKRAQETDPVNGELLLIASVDANGKVSQVRAAVSPAEKMTRFAATLLTLTKFKPAVCDGKPCAMDFPLNQHFLADDTTISQQPRP